MAKKRAEKDKLIEGAAEQFFKAEESAEQARDQLARCELDRAAAVQSLDALGVSAADIADMLALDVKEVRSLRRAKLHSGGSSLEQEALPNEEISSSKEEPATTSAATATA